jgi:DNA-nicking Smr family endonuclease
MASAKRSGGNSAGVPPTPAAEDERQMLERELADVKPWRRGANRISAVDFVADTQPGQPQARPPLAPTGGGGEARHLDVAPDGASGLAFGVSKETVAALRRGDFEFEARCDLHKLHAEAARRKLGAFVQECLRRNLRAGLVICGRGLHSGPEGPVLAKVVTEVLAGPPARGHILAFAPAAARHGGSGAIAVLFRRRPVTTD